MFFLIVKFQHVSEKKGFSQKQVQNLECTVYFLSDQTSWRVFIFTRLRGNGLFAFLLRDFLSSFKDFIYFFPVKKRQFIFSGECCESFHREKKNTLFKQKRQLVNVISLLQPIKRKITNAPNAAKRKTKNNNNKNDEHKKNKDRQRYEPRRNAVSVYGCLLFDSLHTHILTL